MIELEYAPKFLRQFKKLESALQVESEEKIELFKNKNNHRMLKVHKLKGSMRGNWSFSINYKDRIVFKWISANEVALLAIGDHNVYK